MSSGRGSRSAIPDELCSACRRRPRLPHRVRCEYCISQQRDYKHSRAAVMETPPEDRHFRLRQSIERVPPRRRRPTSKGISAVKMLEQLRADQRKEANG